MTERQKKNIVVQRLEQLFTGKRGAKVGENSQPLQQQEVSNSAARADRATRNEPPEQEGAREAHILGIEVDVDVDVDGDKPSILLGDASAGSRMMSDSSDEQSPERSSPRQRPTRPLDLDPDRAQIPSENVEYIRHLGLSTPKLITENSADVAPDAEGWIYLNLLINMAQLHIINVTPEFVRSAVSEVSDKFQLSPDGKKVRWRGGSDGTRMSSDSGECSVRNRSPQESDNDHGNKRRRKDEDGRFASAPVEADDCHIPTESSGPSSLVHYKPLFHHHKSPSAGMMSTDDSDSPLTSGPEMGSNLRKLPRGAHAWNGVAQYSRTKRRRRGDGSMVFYSGAKFCTDLSGDRGNILTPLHVFGIGQDGCSNQAQAVLGSTTQRSTPAIVRTTSGSLLPYRPFKDYSKGNDPFQTEENRPKTPELFDDESESEQFVLGIPPEPASNVRLQSFEASGLGGIQPTDHFAVHVQTRREKSANAQRSKRSRSSRLLSPRKAPKKVRHGITKRSIESFYDITSEETETITNRLAAWPGFSSPPRSTDAATERPLIKTEILSANYVHLAPSQLPPPLGWMANLDSSDDDSSSDASSSSAGVSHLRHGKAFVNESNSSFDPRTNELNDLELIDDSDEADELSDTDSDIDMLAQVRRLDPHVVADQERAFAMQVDDGAGLATEALRSRPESDYSHAISFA